MFKLNCDYRGGAVAVPTEIIDKHLKLAPSASFKVLLFILRNPDGATNEEVISSCTGLSVRDVSDCVLYWINCGIILKTDEENPEAEKMAVGNIKSAAIPKEKPSNVADDGKKQIRSLPVKKPTQREIALRLSEEPELSVIYSEAQSVLGTFGYDTEAIILMIYDYYGFPPEVIITLIQFQKSEGKASTAAIKTRAEDWAKRGIDNLPAVEKEIKDLEVINNSYSKIKEIVGQTADRPSPKIARHLREWAVNREFTPEMISLALSGNGNSFSEADKTLKKWYLSGIKTPSEVKEKKKKNISESFKKSYDTENIGKNSVLDWVKKYADKNESEGDE